MAFDVFSIRNQRFWREEHYTALDTEIGRLAQRYAPPRVTAVCNRLRECVIRAWIHQVDTHAYRILVGEFFISRTDLDRLKALECEMLAQWLRGLAEWAADRNHPGAFWLEQISLSFLFHCRQKQQSKGLVRAWHQHLKAVDRRQESRPFRSAFAIPARPIRCEGASH